MIVEKRLASALGLLRTDQWVGATEGVSGNTLQALADRDLAEIRWQRKPYRRLVGRLTDRGVAALRERGMEPRS